MKISVVIATYNRGQMLLAAVKSALVQSLPPYEIIISDDGSTDNSKALIKGLSSSRVRWLPSPHSGLPSIARNRGVQVARGDWLAFLDSDDQWTPNKLASQVKLVQEKNFLASCSNALRVGPASRTKSKLISSFPKSSISFRDLVSNNHIICSSVLINTALVKRVGLFPTDKSLKALEDYALWLRTITYHPFGYLSEALVKYFDDPKNSLRKDSLAPRQQKYRVLKSWLSWYLNENFTHS